MLLHKQLRTQLQVEVNCQFSIVLQSIAILAQVNQLEIYIRNRQIILPHKTIYKNNEEKRELMEP
jgi:hypothetical protein